MIAVLCYLFLFPCCKVKTLLRETTYQSKGKSIYFLEKKTLTLALTYPNFQIPNSHVTPRLLYAESMFAMQYEF